MINKTYYTNGKNQFKNGEFDGNEWSAPYMVDVNEIKDRINGFNLEGRKIKDIRFIGNRPLIKNGITNVTKVDIGLKKNCGEPLIPLEMK